MSNQDEEKIHTLRARRFPSAKELMKSFEEIGKEFKEKFPDAEVKLIFTKKKEKDEQPK